MKARGLLLLACVTCFGQSSFMGLTPGKSTRADVERVLGQPVKSVSKTLAEYKSPEALWKLYVQYGDESPAAIVERIERTCLDPGGNVHDLSYRVGIPNVDHFAAQYPACTFPCQRFAWWITPHDA